MTISARPTRHSVPNHNHNRVGAVATTAPILDRDRAIDAWIAELYQAAMRPHGWQEFLVSLAEALHLDPMMVVAIGTEGRDVRHIGMDDGPERAALVRLSPNLLGAKRLRDEMCRLALERTARSRFLDRLPIGLLVVDARGRVLEATRVASEILDSADGLVQRDGLEASTANDTNALRRAIGAVASPGADPETRERLCLKRPSGARPWTLEISRVERGSADGAATLPAAAAVVISDGEQDLERDPEALRVYYGLTPAESELAMLLVGGHSLEQAAKRRGVSRNTARGQLKRIFAKTGTNRQAELVRLVLSGPTALGSRH